MTAYDDRIAQARAVDIGSVVAARGGLGLKRGKTELVGACPHCGGTDRFSVCTRKGKQVFNCRGCNAGGDIIDLVQFLDGVDFSHAVETLAGQAKPKSNGHGGDGKLGHQIAEYDYRTETGELLFQVCRFEPKAFRQRRPDGHGHWIWNLDGVRMVLYRLPELIEAIASEHPVVVCEGEKDVHTAVRFGLVATTNPGGAGKWRGEFDAHFVGADVIIVPHRDDAGAKHTQDIAAHLQKVAQRVRVVTLPVKDLSVWEARGGTREQFDRLVENAPEGQGSQRTLNAAEVAAAFTFLGDEPAQAPRELIKKLLPAEGVVITGGQPSAGKTFIEIHKAVCLGTRHQFFGHRVVERVGTVFVAAEGRAWLPNRFAAALAKAAITDKLPIAWINQLPDLTSLEGFKRFIAQLKAMDQRFQDEFNARLGQVTIDTVGACFAMKSEDDNAEATKVCNVLRAISNETRAVTTAVHHYGKNPESGLRGASAWRGSADIIIGVLADIDQLSGRASNRELACVKARDGEQGPISPFELGFVELGLDADNEIFGSCCVIPSEGASRFAKTAKPTKGERIIHDAITEALDNCGKTIVPRAGMPPVKAAKVSDVRAEFDRRYVTAETDPPKVAHTKRMAFKRALDRLPPSHFGAGETDGADWIWKVT